MRFVCLPYVGALVTTYVLGSVATGLAAPAALPSKPPSAVTPGGTAFFETKVRPVLVERCYSCHSSASQPVQGGLKLDSREALLRGGVRGSALVPGDPDRSSLIRALSHADKSLQMPPGGKLKGPEIAALTAWVRMGAPWPAAGAVAPVSKPAAEKFWAWIPPKPPALPRVKNAAWAQNPVDRFILAGLEAKGLAPAPPADRRTLIRRATFDLTGLPPTPAEIADFERECEAEGGRGPGAGGQGAELPAPKAYARLIDRLLASTAYGERWGRHWLDVARYADSNGLDENLVFPNAWRYRDYVIRAINADKPIDRFIQEQIAGDLLPSRPGAADEYDPLVATGYLAIGPKMLAEDDPVKQEEDILDEQIDTFGKTFMGLTLGCARCHDHKFDPFPQTDYYALAGIFKSTRTMTKFTVVAEWQEVPLASVEDREKLVRIEREVGEKRAEHVALGKEAGAAVLAEANSKLAEYEREARRVLTAGDAPALLPAIASPNGPAPAGAVVLEAEDFVNGNVLKDREGYGKGIGVLVNAGNYPNFTEYGVTVPASGLYQLDLRYASGDPRPIRVFVNGTRVASNAAGAVTGGFFPDQQQWKAEGVFRLAPGKNWIRLERTSFFPHIDKLLLLPKSPGDYPRTPDQLAAETGLIPEFVAQVREQLKGAAAGTVPTLKLALPSEPQSLFAPEHRTRLAQVEGEIAGLERQKPRPPRAMAVSEGKPTDVPVHLRGSYLTLGRECPRGFPEILTRGEAPRIPSTQSGRLELAQWLTAPNHPLTSRVFVNRVWRWHFGRGIVPSTDNFGTLGDLPTNQPLLDWLASSFAAGAGGQGSGVGLPGNPTRSLPGPRPLTPGPLGMGWSLKKLHRLLMLSNTYQMSSRYDARSARVDPENKLHWRMERRRLAAEEIRDALFFVSGKLDRTMGGSLLNFKDRAYVTDTSNADPVNYSTPRRAVYVPVIRSALYDVYTAFDFGDPTVMNGDRPSTTVAPQALFVMNGKLVLDNAKALAEALIDRRDLDDAARIQLAYETCYGRKATAAEVGRAREFLSRLDATYQPTVPGPWQRRLRTWQSLCKSLMAASEFIYVD